jgi:hypothetical protein
VGWALLNRDATLAREGEGLIGELPKRSSVTAVVAASRVLLTAAKLPARGARRVRSALAYAIEDQLTERPGIRARRRRSGAAGRQAVDRGGRPRMAAHAAGCTGIGGNAAEVRDGRDLHRASCARRMERRSMRGGAGFVRTDDASGMALDGADDGAVPPLLRLALERARPPARLRKRSSYEAAQRSTRRRGSRNSAYAAKPRAHGVHGRRPGAQSSSCCKASSRRRAAWSRYGRVSGPRVPCRRCNCGGNRRCRRALGRAAIRESALGSSHDRAVQGRVPASPGNRRSSAADASESCCGHVPQQEWRRRAISSRFSRRRAALRRARAGR